MKTLKKSVLEFYPKNTPDILEAILAHRGLTKEVLNQKSFTSPTVEDLHDPFLFPGMDKAVERILKAIENKERVVIFGDYDVDGVSSTAMLVRFFKTLGVDISYRLPHRIHDGYGMKNYFMDELAPKWVKLVISVDCGTKDIETITHAKTLGIDVIVTDHHAVPESIPEDVIALLNPKIPNSSYPFSSLAGSGVALKLLHAVALRFYKDSPKKALEIVQESCDFACLGTVADMMPLIGENRTIVILGLAELKRSRSGGLRKLIEGREINADIIGFHIGPRINAAGRMDSAYKALSLLLTSEDRVDELLAEIESLNAKRKSSCEHFVSHALSVADQNNPILFYESDDIEHGIIGLISGRLTEVFAKPSIVLKRDEDRLVASCRAPEWFDLASFLEQFKELFVAFGGHKQAAGFTITSENFENFKNRAIKSAASLITASPLPPKTLKIDATLDLQKIDTNFLQSLASLAPYGMGFTKPLFLIKAKNVRAESLGQDGKHLRFISGDWSGKINAFGFGEFRRELMGHDEVSFIAELTEEVWMKKKSIVLTVKDIVVE